MVDDATNAWISACFGERPGRVLPTTVPPVRLHSAQPTQPQPGYLSPPTSTSAVPTPQPLARA